ncbi:hypothetical protein ACFQJD_00660 [Haloplanus sp. GCM10025708]|uniref:hypothetical protein n=1 Tax=Haloplanus sp. GCM10025708 TaxID=3252679 RepID=UPI003618B1EA
MGHVYYHHPGDNQFSLDFVHEAPSEIVARIVEYDDDVAVKVRKYDFDSEFFSIYTSRVGGGDVGDLEFDLGEALSEMGADNGTIVARLLEIYQALIAQNEEEEGVPVEAYKSIDIDALPDALNRVSWEAARLMLQAVSPQISFSNTRFRMRTIGLLLPWFSSTFVGLLPISRCQRHPWKSTQRHTTGGSG